MSSSHSESGVDADVVIPVPDSSIPAAIGYSRVSGIPFNDGLIKNRYIGRTFIEPTQDMRERGVALKFNALAENLAGKRVIMIDDSLVRGTTAGPLVKLVRDAGATEVHLRITCPPITHACHFGVDMGHDGDLMAARLTVDEMRDRIGADSLAFLSLDGMMRAVGASEGYCNACFTGRYPIAVGEAQAKLSFEGALWPDAEVLVIGGGGREHAIAWACEQHGHTVRIAAELGAVTAADVDLVIPGPETVLAAGIADECAFRRIPCFGPSSKQARIESSKGFSRDLATSLGVPGPLYRRFDELDVDGALVMVARVRPAGRGQARRPGGGQGRDRSRRCDRDRSRDPRHRRARPVPARGADERAGVLVARAVRRRHRRRPAARPGPQADRRGRHRSEHGRDGRLRAGAGRRTIPPISCASS